MKFLRDRKVRDVLWQVLASVGLVAVVVFFVRNASENMVKAGMASGFQFLWRDSGIEVPFNIVKQVGNYGESYERTVGMGSALKLKRGANELWTKGGLLYSPPFQ